MKTIVEQAKEIRQTTLQVANTLPDEDALSAIILFDEWRANTLVLVNEKYRYKDKLYRVVQSHTTQEGWFPDIMPALFTEVAPPGVIPDWKQPGGAHDAYNIDDKVRHKDKIWISTIASNAYEPGVYGWDEVN